MLMNNNYIRNKHQALHAVKVMAAFVILGAIVTSCYKIIRTYAPTEVTGTETFEARIVTAAGDGDGPSFGHAHGGYGPVGGEILRR